ncbi:MAG: M42 family metallopeptidase [Bacillota bacterium]
MVLKRLTEAAGVAGNEGEVRDLLRELVTPHVDEVRGDTLGNLIAVKKGKKDGPRVMIAAHMDEVGLMIINIEKSGLLRFTKAGGIDDRVLLGKKVLVGKDKVPGVIGAKPIHLQEPKEREVPIKVDNLFIDIGAKEQADAEKKVKVGDYAVFATQYEEFGQDKIKAKALDDRVGCAVLLEVLKDDYEIPIYGAFTVMEEIGTRGAAVAAYAISPDIGIVLEGTVCADFVADTPEGHATTSGAGPALSIMDATSIGNKVLLRHAVRLAEENGIPYQFRRATTGGNDAGRIHLNKEGVPSISVSVPCRYIHSPVSVISNSDYENAIKLVRLFLKSIQEGGLEL